MHDEIHMDGIERRYVGPHASVLLRIDHNLVRSIMAFKRGRNEPETATAKVVPIKRRAA